MHDLFKFLCLVVGEDPQLRTMVAHALQNLLDVLYISQVEYWFGKSDVSEMALAVFALTTGLAFLAGFHDPHPCVVDPTTLGVDTFVGLGLSDFHH